MNYFQNGKIGEVVILDVVIADCFAPPVHTDGCRFRYLEILNDRWRRI